MDSRGLIVALAACTACGSIQRHLEQHQRTQETSANAWQKNAASTATSSATSAKREDVRKVRRRVRRETRPDGTTIVTDTTTTVDKGVVASSSSTAVAVSQSTAEGASKRQAAQTSDNLSGVRAGTGWSRWWLLLLLLIPAGLALWRWKLEPFRRVWHLVKQR